MEVATIRTERDHHRALKEVEGLMAAGRNTPEGNQLRLLVTQIESWEAKHCPLDSPSTAG